MPEKGQALKLGLGLLAEPHRTKGTIHRGGMAKNGGLGGGPRLCALSPRASLEPGGDLGPVLLA